MTDDCVSFVRHFGDQLVGNKAREFDERQFVRLLNLIAIPGSAFITSIREPF
ncbi:hypothetical protein [Malonomonas rubra]|uniref:hypothetical protein n=1 Tax=Malonomonas rubra TaxID=57040 RepID=UPI0026EFD948|nr:hypothetical protein [Malonomonas rubra]